MNNVVVAPNHPDLSHLPDEAASIAELIPGETKVLAGDVVVRTLLDYLTNARVEDYNLLWFCTHGDANGLWLSDGEYLAAEPLAGILASWRFRGVVLNSCYSSDMVHTIQRVASLDIVASLQDVPDRDAWLTARLMAVNLQRTGKLSTSVLASTAYSAGRYHFWPAPLKTKDPELMAKDSNDTMTTWRGQTDQRLKVLEDNQLLLRRAIFGDEMLDYKGVREQLRNINRWIRFVTVFMALISIALIIMIWIFILHGFV